MRKWYLSAREFFSDRLLLFPRGGQSIEATRVQLKKAYAEARQLEERQWAREISPQSAQRATEKEGKTSHPTKGAAAPVGTPRRGVRSGQCLTTGIGYDALAAQLLRIARVELSEICSVSLIRALSG